MTSFLGVVPARNELTWAIVEVNDTGSVSLHSKKKESIPDLGTRDREMAWVYTKIVETFGGGRIKASCVVQGAIGQSRTEAVLFRAQVEGVILAALSSLKMTVHSQKKAAMVTVLGLKRGAQIEAVAGLQDLHKDSTFPKYFDEAVVAALAART